jgi:hypothetical protein
MPGGHAEDSLSFLDREFDQATTVPIDGYCYQAWLSDGADAALDQSAATARVAAGDLAWANQAERYFLVYAWPATPAAGQRVFVLNQSGRIYAATADGMTLPPAWNAACTASAGPARELFRTLAWSEVPRRAAAEE